MGFVYHVALCFEPSGVTFLLYQNIKHNADNCDMAQVADRQPSVKAFASGFATIDGQLAGR